MNILESGVWSLKLKNGYSVIGNVDADMSKEVKVTGGINISEVAVLVQQQGPDGKPTTSLVEYEPLALDYKFTIGSETIDHIAQPTKEAIEVYEKFVESLHATHSEEADDEVDEEEDTETGTDVAEGNGANVDRAIS